MDFIKDYHAKTEIAQRDLLAWLNVRPGKFHDWQDRFGKVNEHNAKIPRDHWLTPDETKKILDYYHQHPLEGYRRMTFMMLDDNVVAVSPTSVWRVLKKAGVFNRPKPPPSKKGKGYEQPLRPHQEWHIDVTCVHIGDKMYFLCALLDGYSRFVVHWELHETMPEGTIEIIVQRAKERFPQATPRIISDNGPQFVAKDFQEFLGHLGMTHVRTSPYYPQGNGKIERWHKSLKLECIHPLVPMTLEDAKRMIGQYVEHYNTVRLHSAIGYVTPKDRLEGRDEAITKERDRKLAEARERRKQLRSQFQLQSDGSDNRVSQRPSVDFAELRRMLTLAQVLTLLEWKPKRVKGSQQRGACPVHLSGRKCQSFSANLEANVYHCFKCGCCGGPLDLWIAVKGQSVYEAALDVCRRLALEVPTNPTPQGGQESRPRDSASNDR